MTVGERIRRIRTAHELSLNDVAEQAKISVATLSRIERDKQGLDLGVLLLLARILKTAPHELIGDESDNVDPLAVRIAALKHSDRMELWRELTRQRAARVKTHNLHEEVAELLAQLEYVRAEMESMRARIRQR